MKKKLFVFTAVLFFALALSSCKKDETNNNGNSGSNGNNGSGGNTTAVYVDLGLPSGTKWKSANEYGNGSGYYTFDEAVNTFGNNLPTEEQCWELITLCTWSRQENYSYKVTGLNGNEIVLPITGYYGWSEDNNNYIYCGGNIGIYWTSTPCPDEDDCCYTLMFTNDPMQISSWSKTWSKLSVRLVQK